MTVSRSVVPVSLKTRRGATSAVRVYRRRATHACGYYLLRSPKYLTRLLRAVPAGAWLLLHPILLWISDRASRDMVDALLAHSIEGVPQAEAAQAFQRSRGRRQRRRFILAVMGLVVLLFAGRVEQAKIPTVFQPFVVAAIVLALGLLGRKRPIIDVPASVTDPEVQPTEDVLSSALLSLRRPGMKVTFVDPVTRDEAGWRAVVNLGGDIPAEDIIARRDRLAAALNVQSGRLFLSAPGDRPSGTLQIWLADHPASQAKALPWPLACGGGSVNLYEPVELGTDEQGHPLRIKMMRGSGLLGAAPNMGKSSALRLLLLTACLDPRADVYVLNAKGGNAYEEVAPLAAGYCAGGTKDDLLAILEILHRLEADVHRRYVTLRSLPPQVCPDGVTDHLASQAGLGLHPVVVGIDECHLCFKDGALGKEFHRVLEYLIRVGREAGVVVWLATQRPDSDSVPTDISSSIVFRGAFMVMTSAANDMALGTGMFRSGVRATEFCLDDAGQSIFIGSGKGARHLRWYYVDRMVTEEVVTRALAVRPPPPPPAPVDESVVDHLLSIWPQDQERVRLDELTAMLRSSHPELYGGCDEDVIFSAVWARGVSTVPVNRRVDGIQVNRRGLRRTDLR